MIEQALNGHRLLIRSADGQKEEWLTCINPDSFSKDSQVSTTFQLSFTAFLDSDDGNSFDLLQNDAYIILDGQKYMIMQCTPKYVDDLVTKDITATHEIFGMQWFRQYQINKGIQTYSIDSMLGFIFGSQYNTEGYTYKINGSFPTVDIADWGNCSGLDAVQKAVDSYGAKWYPIGKTVMIFNEDTYKNATNKQYIWSHNTNDIELSVDSTGIVNGAMLYGATIDDEHNTTADGTSTSDSTGTAGGSGGGGSTSAATSTGGASGTISTMDDGGAPVYSSPVGSSSLTGQKLPNGSHWAVSQQVSIDGVTWYKVGNNAWINGKYMPFNKANDVKPEDHVIEQTWGQGTIKAADVTTGSGDDSTTTTPTSAKVYNSPYSGQQAVSGRDLANGGQFKINGTVSNGAGGKTWYRVATDEWICADDINFDGDTDVEPTSQESTTDDTKADTDEVKYYFTPFFYYNQASASVHGLRAGEDITNDQIKDPEAMKKYADSVFQTDPIVELTVNVSYQDDTVKLGDTSYLNAEPLGIETMITLNGISGNILTNDTPITITLDNSTVSRTNINYDMSDKIRLANRNNKLLTQEVRKLSAKLNAMAD